MESSIRRVIELMVVVPLACNAAAQMPDFYKSVDRMVWVVDDLNRVEQGWRRTGLLSLQPARQIDSQVDFRGKQVHERIRVASGFFGDVRVDCIQPVGGESAYADFQKRHALGVFSLVHRVATLSEFQAEIDRLGKAGVGVLEQGEWSGAGEAIHYAYFDTEQAGKYVLGLIYIPVGNTEATMPPDSKRITQFAFAVSDLKAVSAFWERVGFSPMAFTGGNLSDVRYRGNPVPIDQNFGWQRGRKVVYEWLQPVSLPSLLEDHIKQRGEGLEHLALQVPDMPAAVKEWRGFGFQEYQSGAWGEAGKKGSGRFDFVDTEPIGGFAVELLWNFPQ